MGFATNSRTKIQPQTCGPTKSIFGFDHASCKDRTRSSPNFWICRPHPLFAVRSRAANLQVHVLPSGPPCRLFRKEVRSSPEPTTVYNSYANSSIHHTVNNQRRILLRIELLCVSGPLHITPYLSLGGGPCGTASG